MDINTQPLRAITARPDLNLTAENYQRWPYTLPIVRQALTGLTFPPLTVITGENGAGKSTLIESIADAYGLPHDGGPATTQRHSSEKTSAFGADLTTVKGASSLRGGIFFRAETMHSYALYLQEANSDYGHKLLTQSHGEGTLDLLSETAHRYALWILDEPESGLSFTGQLTLSARILTHLKQGGQIILSTHSPILASLAAHIGTTIWDITDHGIQPTPWATHDMVHHWRTILDDPETYLRHLT